MLHADGVLSRQPALSHLLSPLFTPPSRLVHASGPGGAAVWHAPRPGHEPRPPRPSQPAHSRADDHPGPLATGSGAVRSGMFVLALPWFDALGGGGRTGFLSIIKSCLFSPFVVFALRRRIWVDFRALPRQAPTRLRPGRSLAPWSRPFTTLAAASFPRPGARRCVLVV